jgi:hypothetical protein
MEHILTKRGIDFDAYHAYFSTVRDRLSPHVRAFAGDARHYSLDDPETLHDAWVMDLRVSESVPNDGTERTTSIEIRLLGGSHRVEHVLRYAGVRRYIFSADSVNRGHGDVIAHEVRLAANGTSVEHEYLLENAKGQSRIVVECDDFTHDLLPSGGLTS